jgi:hypothetical protein
MALTEFQQQGENFSGHLFQTTGTKDYNVYKADIVKAYVGKGGCKKSIMEGSSESC